MVFHICPAWLRGAQDPSQEAQSTQSPRGVKEESQGSPSITLSTIVKEDELVKLVGGWGRWQLVVVFSVCLVKLSSGWVQMAIVFLTPQPKFWCVEPPGANDTCVPGCTRYGFDPAPMHSTAVTEWALVCDRSWMASLTQTALQLGVLLGSLLFGYLSDRFGRRPTFLLAVTALAVAGLAVPLAPDYWTFTTLRLLLGAAVAGTMVVSFVIVVETVGPRYRELAGCLFQIPFIVGHMTVPLFAYYCREWRGYTLALAVPPLAYGLYFFTLQESPRWLLSQGRAQHAADILKRAARMNKLPTDHIEETVTKLSSDLHSSQPRTRPHYGMLAQRGLRVRTGCVCAMWLVAGLSFFGLNQYIGQTSPNPFLSVAAAGAIQIPANLASIWLVSRLGRRRTLALGFALAGLSVVALVLAPRSFALELALGTLGVSFAAIVATAIYIYSSELFPTVVRNMGMGVCSTSMRVGSMLAPFAANQPGPWARLLAFGLAPLLAALLLLPLPETRNEPLPDVIQQVDEET